MEKTLSGRGFSQLMMAPLLLAFLLSVAASANVGDDFGFGSRDAALAGAALAQTPDGFAAWTNPAAMAHQRGDRLSISYGWIFIQPSFTPIDNIVLENDTTSDKTSAVSGNVDLGYRSTLGQEIGLTYKILPETGSLSVGIAAFLPLNQLAYLDSGEPYAPEYVLYRARSQQPQFGFGTGFALHEKFKIGAGLQFGYSTTVNSTFFVQSSPSGSTTSSPSSARVAASVKPKAAPYFSVLFEPSNGFSLAAMLRLARKTDTLVVAQAGTQLVSSLPALDIAFNATSVAAYDPMSASFGGAISPASNLKLIAQLDYQRWSQFEAPTIVIQDPSLSNCDGNLSDCGIRLNSGANSMPPTRDIVIPRAGVEIGLSTETALRVGYAYRPGIFSAMPSGAQNLLDPDKHIFAAGLGFKFKRFLHFNVPCSIDTHATWHKLVGESVTKTSSDQIGAPGYETGGNLLGGGVSLSLAL